MKHAVQHVQEATSPEIGLLLFDRPNAQVTDLDSTSADLDELVSNNFLEFITEELLSVTQENRNTGGLLG